MTEKIKVLEQIKFTGRISRKGEPTSGRVIVNGPGLHKSIPAVVFSEEQGDKLFELRKRMNSELVTTIDKEEDSQLVD